MAIKEENLPIQLNNVRNQYFATLAVNLLAIGYGTILGWVSPALPKLASVDTPLTKPLTNNELSWIGSVNCIGAIFGCFCFGYLISIIGSKRAILILILPCIAFWLLIYFGNSYYHITIARFIGGWAGGGIQSAILLYISEIADDDIRGRLSSVLLLALNIGMFIAYILGSIFDYKDIPIICVSIPIVFAVIFVTLPNTSRFYLQRGKIQEAESALRFYKGYNRENGNVDRVNAIIRDELDRLKVIATERKTNEKLQTADFVNRSAIKGLGIGVALTAVSHCTAYYTLTSYAVIIFQKVGASLDPHFSSIMLAIALIFGSLATTYFADILGRKILILVSLIGSAIGLFVTALFHYFYLNGYDLSYFQWVPVVSLSFVIFIASAGIMPLAFICSVEYLPPKIRNFGMAIVVFSSSFSLFIFIKSFPILLEIIDLYGCMAIHGSLCIVATVFVAFVLRETAGQNLDDVGLDEKAKTRGDDAENTNNI